MIEAFELALSLTSICAAYVCRITITIYNELRISCAERSNLIAHAITTRAPTQRHAAARVVMRARMTQIQYTEKISDASRGGQMKLKSCNGPRDGAESSYTIISRTVNP